MNRNSMREPVIRWLMDEVRELLRGRLPETLSVEERTKLAVLISRIDTLIGEQRPPGNT